MILGSVVISFIHPLILFLLHSRTLVIHLDLLGVEIWPSFKAWVLQHRREIKICLWSYPRLQLRDYFSLTINFQLFIRPRLILNYKLNICLLYHGSIEYGVDASPLAIHILLSIWSRNMNHVWRSRTSHTETIGLWVKDKLFILIGLVTIKWYWRLHYFFCIFVSKINKK